jgi:hypothetical protein
MPESAAISRQLHHHPGHDPLHAIDPAIFPTGSNAKGVDLVERECPGAFWKSCGRTMRRLGYAKLPVPPTFHVAAPTFDAAAHPDDLIGSIVNQKGRRGAVEPRPQTHDRVPIDGDWIAATGFGGAEGPFPAKGINHRFHWAIGEPAVLRLYSAQAGVRTLSLRIGGISHWQRIGVRINGGQILHRRIGKVPKLERVTFRVRAAIGLMTVEFTTDRWMTTPEGRRLGLMLGGVDLANETQRWAWLRRFLPHGRVGA